MARHTRLTRPCRRQGRGGFSLLEIMIVLAVVTIIIAIVGSTIISSIRVSEQEKTLVEMDTNATLALNSLSAALRQAVLPITTGSGDTTGFNGTLNDKTKGFGKNGKQWADFLKRGGDLIAFTVPVDADGDGDALDADFLPELGITNSIGQAIPGGSYTGTGKLTGNINSSLAEREPGDFGLNTGSGDIDLTHARFADAFVFPASSTTPTYGVIRFVPLRDAGQVIILDEAKMKLDLNEDGDTDDTYALGQLVLCLPGRTNPFKADSKYLSRSSVLLQLNRDDGWDPLFRLSRYKEGDTSENMDTTSGSPSAGDFTLHVKLLLCDNLGQRNPTAFNSRLPFISRTFDRVVVLRNMSIR